MNSILSISQKFLLPPITLILFVFASIERPVLRTSQYSDARDCLGSDDSLGDFDIRKHTDCYPDPFGVASQIEIEETEKMFGLHKDQIVFVGCKSAPFQTRVISTIPPYRFRILYRSTGDAAKREYIVPILHEIGHVYQLQPYGNNKDLLASLCDNLERVELGADFLAGLAVQWLKINPGEFETNLDLMGSYKADHGRPEDRAAAFRSGWHSPPTKSFDPSQYKEFQDDFYAQIKHSGATR